LEFPQCISVNGHYQPPGIPVWITVIASDPDVIVTAFKRTAVTGDEIDPSLEVAVVSGNADITNHPAVEGLNVLEKTSS
jgi:hypothetical protein